MENINYISEGIKNLGGVSAAARALGVTTWQSLQSWEKYGQIPPKYCVKFETLSGISRKLLRPDDWQDIWPELLAAGS